MDKRNIYFVSDVHLGLEVNDPVEREARFVAFLRSIPADATHALYLLGDIWDFWYEYRDVVPKGSVRVFAALMDLMDAGVEVYFCRGNHDIWCYSYFESMGMHVISQPHVFEFCGKTFCVGHGDGLGDVGSGYKLMNAAFKCRALQWLFSLLHPWLAFRLGKGWSKNNRLSRGCAYEFKGEQEPLYRYAEEFGRPLHVDYFIFGHYHAPYSCVLPCGAQLLLLDDWMDASDYLYFDGITVGSGHCRNTE